jgi:hypothetical protein
MEIWLRDGRACVSENGVSKCAKLRSASVSVDI